MRGGRGLLEEATHPVGGPPRKGREDDGEEEERGRRVKVAKKRRGEEIGSRTCEGCLGH